MDIVFQLELVGLVGSNMSVTIWSVTGVIVIDLFDAYHLILLDISLCLSAVHSKKMMHLS